MDEDLEYLRSCLQAANFIPYPWDGEDKNLAAFRSREELIAWYCQPPGKDGEPYRDRGFYTRELAMLSRKIKPKVITEFGTSLGIGTCLLHWLNPKAYLVTIDNRNTQYLPGNLEVETGYLAKWQKFGYYWQIGNSWESNIMGVNLCFIDADHSYEAVVKDSQRAWEMKSEVSRWAIVWHDYNDKHLGVKAAVHEFISTHVKDIPLGLQMRQDSDTVWISGGG